MIIINDIHVGTNRRAGTTPASQQALREWHFERFETLMHPQTPTHIVINGDLFDRFEVDAADLIRTYGIITDSIESGNEITLIMGNHDASAKAGKVSSFHLLAHFLRNFSRSVRIIDHTDGLSLVRGSAEPQVWAISHQMNQDLFDMQIDAAVAAVGKEKVLLLHCNIKNNFAEESDHSLNINDEQLNRLMLSGWTVVVGHEHQQRTMRGGRVLVVGNQIPTSVSDMLGCDGKYYATVEDKVELHKLPDVRFCRMDWRQIDEVPADAEFIRIEGEATAEEASHVIDAIAKLRQTHEAFVITNSTAIEGVQMDILTELSIDQLTKFDVLEALCDELEEHERKIVKELLNDV